MADTKPQQTNRSLGDSFPRSISPQRDNHALRSDGVLFAASNGQHDSPWEGVPSAVWSGPVPTQGALQDPRHINLAQYDLGLEDYRLVPDDPAVQVPNAYLEIGLDQGDLERERAMFPVCGNFSFFRMFSTRPFAAGQPKKWLLWLCSPGCCTRPYPGRDSWSVGPPEHRLS